MSCWTGSALDLHLSDVSLARLDKELDEQDGSDLGPTGKNEDTWRSCQGAWGWPGLSFQESLNGPRVGEVPSPSSRTLQPRQDQPHISSVYLHLSKVAPAEMDGGGVCRMGATDSQPPQPSEMFNHCIGTKTNINTY